MMQAGVFPDPIYTFAAETLGTCTYDIRGRYFYVKAGAKF
jgi:hypothetical protein